MYSWHRGGGSAGRRKRTDEQPAALRGVGQRGGGLSKATCGSLWMCDCWLPLMSGFSDSRFASKFSPSTRQHIQHQQDLI